MSNKLTIFFSCDDNYVPFLAVALKSLQQNASKNKFYDIKILNCNNICEQNKIKILNEFDNSVFNLEFVDVSDYVKDFNSKLHTRDYYSKSTYYRLFIPNMYPSLDKALYLDSDIVINGDIFELYNTNLGNNLVGAITDKVIADYKVEFKEYAQKRIGVKNCNNYFNAGVLLMNLKELRVFNFEQLFLDLLTRVTFDLAQDQDYLNVICKDRIKFIDKTWNQMPFKGNNELLSQNPKLVHYNLSFKPWQTDNVLFGEMFWKYAKQTSFYNEILNIRKNFTSELQQKAENQTLNLIKLAKTQADDSLKNLQIHNIINNVFLQNLKGNYGKYYNKISG